MVFTETTTTPFDETSTTLAPLPADDGFVIPRDLKNHSDRGTLIQETTSSLAVDSLLKPMPLSSKDSPPSGPERTHHCCHSLSGLPLRGVATEGRIIPNNTPLSCPHSKLLASAHVLSVWFSRRTWMSKMMSSWNSSFTRHCIKRIRKPLTNDQAASCPSTEPHSGVRKHGNEDHIEAVHPTDAKRRLCPMNRWLILWICLVLTTTTGSFFFNWPATQKMLLRNGAYSWLCHKGDPVLLAVDEQNGGQSLEAVLRSIPSQEWKVGDTIYESVNPDQLSVLLYKATHANGLTGEDNSEALQNSEPLLSAALLSNDGAYHRLTSFLEKRHRNNDHQQQKEDRSYQVESRLDLDEAEEQALLEEIENDGACLRQVQTVNSLMPIGVAAWFCCSFIGGVAVDILGPKVTSCAGLFLSASGWLLLSVCSKHFAVYREAFALIGGGVDIIFIGVINTANLFPGYRGTVVSLFNAARSLAFAIPAAMCAILDAWPEMLTYRHVTTAYAILLFCWIGVVVVLLPWKPYPNRQLVQNAVVDDNVNLSPKEETSFSPYSETDELQRGSNPSNGNSGGFDSLTTLASYCEEPAPTSERRASHPALGHLANVFSRETWDEKVHTADVIQLTTLVPDRKPFALPYPPNLPLFQRMLERTTVVCTYIRSPLFYPMVLYAVFTVLRGSFLANSAKDQLGPFVNLFAILTPLSFIPAPLFGYMADKVSIHGVLLLLNSLGTLQFVFLMIATQFFLGCATTLNVLISAFFLGQIYCYITFTFPSEYSGTLIGVAVSLSGLFGLLVTPMYNYSTNGANFTTMNGLCLGFCAICYGCIYILWRAALRNKRQSS